MNQSCLANTFVLARRKPKLLLRLAERTLSGLLFQLPPRFTRLEPYGPSSQIHHCRKLFTAHSQGISVDHVTDHAANRTQKQVFIECAAMKGRLPGVKFEPESYQTLLWQTDG